MSAKVGAAASNVAEAKNRTLLIIDPQNDFHGGGSLQVPGADEDAQRIAE